MPVLIPENTAGGFERCSDAGACLHPHEVFYNHCMYRDNLEAGRIFYGKNRTV